MIVQLHKNEKEKNPNQTYKDIIARIGEVTGIGRQSIIYTISEYKKTGKISSPIKTRKKKSLFDKIDDLDRNGLRQKVYSIWLRRELPTMDKILCAVNDDPTLPCFKRTSLYRIIKKLDFVSTKRKRCSVLTEREDLIVLRRNYLSDIRKYRAEGRSIYYLDEACVNVQSDNTTETAKTDEKASRKQGALKGLTTNLTGKRLIVLHVGSHKGFLPGALMCFESKTNSLDYLDEISGDDFRKWFKSIVSNLDPNSVIVLDNAPCHSVEKEKAPVSYWNKADILAWLDSKGVKIDRPMLRAQLVSKMREVESLCKSYVIDDIATDAGHTVLRLPHNHYEFNPILLAWAMVRGHIKQHSISNKVDDERQVLETAIERVTAENWQHFIEQTIGEENKIWEVDDIMDEILDSMEPCAIKTKEETSSCDSSDE